MVIIIQKNANTSKLKPTPKTQKHMAQPIHQPTTTTKTNKKNCKKNNTTTQTNEKQHKQNNKNKKEILSIELI
ncbi:MAG: hypothetical protein ISP01_00130 [Methanobrevibacter arboriphilus]|uniref:Uncharacterized protein n=1 Tax=Methanobrevibacter arboriphilus TaxID=39441 RepID=A0A843ADC3_METAZ|nr:hypothetical protein [Methanobrevibacter arboriphilus]MBF4467791.1 hypothetical protein [Methanobrevibacter arboriphilus]